MPKSQYNYRPAHGREIEAYYRRGVWRSDEEQQSTAKRYAYEWYGDRHGIAGELNREQREAAERWLESLKRWYDIDTQKPLAPQIERGRAEGAERREREIRLIRLQDESTVTISPNIGDGHGGIDEAKYFAWLNGEDSGGGPARQSRTRAGAGAKPKRRSKLNEDQIVMVQRWVAEGVPMTRIVLKLADQGVEISRPGLTKILKPRGRGEPKAEGGVTVTKPLSEGGVTVTKPP